MKTPIPPIIQQSFLNWAVKNLKGSESSDLKIVGLVTQNAERGGDVGFPL